MIRDNMRIMVFFMLFIFSQFLNLAPLSANNWGLEKQKLEHDKCDSIILHYDGTKWIKHKSDTNYLLLGIWGNRKDNIYIVGYNPESHH